MKKEKEEKAADGEEIKESVDEGEETKKACVNNEMEVAVDMKYEEKNEEKNEEKQRESEEEKYTWKRKAKKSEEEIRIEDLEGVLFIKYSVMYEDECVGTATGPKRKEVNIRQEAAFAVMRKFMPRQVPEYLDILQKHDPGRYNYMLSKIPALVELQCAPTSEEDEPEEYSLVPMELPRSNKKKKHARSKSPSQERHYKKKSRKS